MEQKKLANLNNKEKRLKEQIKIVLLVTQWAIPRNPMVPIGTISNTDVNLRVLHFLLWKRVGTQSAILQTLWK